MDADELVDAVERPESVRAIPGAGGLASRVALERSYEALSLCTWHFHLPLPVLMVNWTGLPPMIVLISVPGILRFGCFCMCINGVKQEVVVVDDCFAMPGEG